MKKNRSPNSKLYALILQGNFWQRKTTHITRPEPQVSVGEICLEGNTSYTLVNAESSINKYYTPYTATLHRII